MKLKWTATDWWADAGEPFTVRVWENFDDWSWSVVPDDGTIHPAASGFANSPTLAKAAVVRALKRLQAARAKAKKARTGK